MAVTRTPTKWYPLFDANRLGGENNYAEESMIAPHEAAETLNVRIAENGMLQTRKGKQSFYTPTYTGTPDGLARVYQTEVAASGDQLGKALIWRHQQTGHATEPLYYGIFFSEDGSSETKLIDAVGPYQSGRFRVVQWKGQFCILFGYLGHAYYWGLDYNATADTPRCPASLDTTVPTYTPTATSGDVVGAGASTAGYFSCAVTGLGGPTDNNWYETASTPAAAGFDMTGSTNKEYSTNNLKTTGYAWCGAWAVYATVGGYATAAEAQAAPMYYVGSRAHPDASAKFDWVDGDHDFTKPLPTSFDVGRIPNSYNTLATANFRSITYGVIHNERFYCTIPSKPDRVYYSNLGEPTSFPTGNWFHVNGETITQLYSFNGTLVIFTYNSIYVMDGWAPEDFDATKRKVIANYGCIAPDSVAAVDTRQGPQLFFVSRDGIRSFDGHQIRFAGERVQGHFDNITDSNIANMVAITHGDLYRLAYQDDTATGAYNNREIIYNARKDIWYTHEGQSISCYAKWDGSADDGELYYGSDDATGGIYKMNTGTDTMEWLYRTGYHIPEGVSMVKDGRAFRLTCSKEGLPMTITLKFDDGDNEWTQTIPAPPTKAGPSGGYNWAAVGDNTVIVDGPIGNKQFRTVSARFYANDSKNHQLLRFEIGAGTIPGRDRY